MRVQNCDPRTVVQEPFRVAYVTDEESSSARPARRTSLFGNPTFGGPAGDQKSPLRRCFKPRPLVENECKPVASDRRSGCGAFDPLRFFNPLGPSTPAAVRPLVRMPTDRHAATGTCELGKEHLRNQDRRYKMRIRPPAKFCPVFLHEIGADASPGKFARKLCRRTAVSRAGLLIRKCLVANLFARASRKNVS
jgi:hypothetical protein